MNAKMNVFVMFSVLFSVFFAPLTYAKGNNVLAVLSFENPAYRETLKGFAAASGLTVTEYVMAADEKELSSVVIGAKTYDIVFTIGSRAFTAVKKTAVPVVFSMVFVDPSDGGSGVTLYMPDQVKVDKIKEFLPKAKRVGIIYSEESASAFAMFSAAAAAAGFTVAGKKIADIDGFSAALESVAPVVDCYLMLPDTKLYTSQTIKALFAASISKKMPVIGLSSLYTKAGAYISLDCDYADMGTQAGQIAADIAGGKKGRVVYPRKITVSINSSIAKTIGIEDVSSKADQIFQ